MTAGARLPNAFQLLQQELLSGAQSSTFTSNVFDKVTYNTCTVQVHVSAAGATPSATLVLEGSVDGTNWYSVPYRTPVSDTSSNANITVTAVGGSLFYVDPKFVRFLRVRCTANTNVTLDSVLATAVF